MFAPDLGIFWRALEWKMLKYFIPNWYFNVLVVCNVMDNGYILWSFGTFLECCTKKDLATLL
jgi:hypothetical protein